MGTPQTEYEFCTECGNFVESLNEWTGWCYSCSVKNGEIAPSCPKCNESNLDGKLCSKCKYVLWLERNANAIEEIIAIQYTSVRVAKKVVSNSNRPICLSCGQPIKGGQKGRHYFCRKRPECIKAHNAYSYHTRNKPHEEAIALAITASLIYKLTTNIKPLR